MNTFVMMKNQKTVRYAILLSWVALFSFSGTKLFGQCQADFFYQAAPLGSVQFTDNSGSLFGNIDSWYWDFGDGDTSGLQNPNHMYNGFGPYYACLTITTTAPCTSTFCDSIRFFAEQDSVWPGDANYDGVANNLDVLAIGLSGFRAGPARFNASLSWEAQFANTWNDSILGNVDVKHCDTDGNGMIAADDTLAISLNYGLTHNKRSNGTAPGNPPFYIEVNDDELSEGDTLIVDLFLGHDTMQVDSFYGLAFSVNMDYTLVDSTTLKVNYPLLSPGGIMEQLTFTKQLTAQNKVDGAITKTLGFPIDYDGPIGQIIVEIDNLDVKTYATESTQTLSLYLTDVKCLSHLGEEIVLNIQNDSTTISLKPNGVEPVPSEEIEIYPNPVSDALTLSHLSGYEQVRIFDVQGKLCHSYEIISEASATVTLSLQHLQKGQYFLEVLGDGKERKRFKIQLH